MFVVERRSTGSWMLLSLARIGMMPLCALATCAVFAPQARQRWWLLASGVSEGVLFLGYLFASGALASLIGR